MCIKRDCKVGHRTPWELLGKYKAHPLRSALCTPEAYIWEMYISEIVWCLRFVSTETSGTQCEVFGLWSLISILIAIFQY